VREKKEVIKSSAAIHISNNVSLLQRHAWNALLGHAYDELPTMQEHRIRVRDLMRILEFNSKNELYLKEMLKALTTCPVEWNILGKDGEEEWGVTTLLAQVVFRRGVCIYAYSPELRRRLYNPHMYARINLTMQNKLSSKHAQALWELCVDYYDVSRGYGETPFIPLPKYRKLMGVSDDMYPEFKKLNKWVIKDPVEEINRVTDFHVTAEPRRESRKVTAVKFRTRRIQQLPALDNRTLPLFPDIEDMPPVVRELKEAGLSAPDAWEIYQQGPQYVKVEPRPKAEAFEEYVYEKIHLLKRQQAAGKVKSVTGFLLQAIRDNYANPDYAEEMKRQEAKRQQDEKRAHKRELEKLQGQKILAEKVRRNDAHEVCVQLMADLPDSLDKAAAALRQKDELFAKLYQPMASPLENYRNKLYMEIRMDEELELLYPERFREVCAPHDAEMAAIDAKVTELQQAAE
jgi:hypothetical protein